jgi:phosphoribosylformylglycinamidine (FGAM) synthase PurS component
LKGSKIIEILRKASNIVGILAIENGGTGSDTKNFVDLNNGKCLEIKYLTIKYYSSFKKLEILRLVTSNLLTNTIVEVNEVAHENAQRHRQLLVTNT